MIQTKAQRLYITDFPYIIRDYNCNVIYIEDKDNSWGKYAYDSNGNQTKFESSTGYWRKTIYGNNNKMLKYNDSKGVWVISSYDENNDISKYEDSFGNYWEITMGMANPYYKDNLFKVI
jgi:hypothetical protein